MRKPTPPPARGEPTAFVRAVDRLDNWLSALEALLLATAILLMAGNSIANVIGRWLLGQSLYFSEELNQALIVLVTFIGLGYAARQGRHIRMSALYDQFPLAGRKVLMTVITAGTGVMLLILAWYAYGYVAKSAQLGRVTPALQIPLYVTYLCVPLGLAVSGVQYMLTALKNLGTREVYLSPRVTDDYAPSPDEGAL